MEEVIAIFDISKTTKSFYLFDRDYRILYEKSEPIKKSTDDDGDACEDLEDITQWVKRTFYDALKDKRFEVKAVNFTGYGASLVHINKQGKTVGQLYDYMKPFPKDLLEEFLDKYGPRTSFELSTGAPLYGMSNVGLQLFWLKNRKPELFKGINHSLHLPQYLSYLFTGRAFTEVTCVGCHTTLWDYGKDRSHDWLFTEKFNKLFPPLIKTTSNEKVRIKGKNISCGIGIHNSSSSLVPYLMTFEESFLQVNTGMWSVSFNPFSKEYLSEEDLKRDCLYFLTYEGNPIRATRLFLGNEHDNYLKDLIKHFKVDEGAHKAVKLSETTLKKLLTEGIDSKKFFPQTMNGTGPFPALTGKKPDLNQFASFEEAYHQLILDLAYLQAESIRIAIGSTVIEKIFFSGEFSYNELFVKILATMFPSIRCFTSNVSGSAVTLGAALLMNTHWNIEKQATEIIDFKEVKPAMVSSLKEYELVKS